MGCKGKGLNCPTCNKKFSCSESTLSTEKSTLLTYQDIPLKDRVKALLVDCKTSQELDILVEAYKKLEEVGRKTI